MKSISNQILAYILISLSVVFVARYFYLVHNRTQFETERLEKINIRTCERLARFVANPILNHDLKLVKEYIAVEALDENIGSIQVLNLNNQLYARVVQIKEIGRSIRGNRPNILYQDSIVRPVLHQGKVIGKVILYPNKKPLNQLVERERLKFLTGLSVLFLIIAVLLFFILKKVIINPISSLKVWVSSIDADKSIAEPKISHSIEIDTIIDSVSQLTNRFISSQKEILAKSNQIFENESLMSAISTNLSEGMIYRLVTNDNGGRKFTYLSGSFQKIYGHTPEEGMKDASLIFGSVVKEDIPLLLEAEAKSKKNLSTYRCEVRMMNPDGTIRISRFVSTPTLMEDGSICWDGLELDITDLNRLQADLQQSKFLLESITEGLPDLVFAKDLNGRFLFVNSEMAKMANKNPEKLLGKNDFEVYPPDEAQKIMETDSKIMESGKRQTFEEKLTTSSGNVFYLTTKGPIKDVQGNTVGLFGIARDITDLKKAQADLQQNQFLLQSITDGLPDSIFAKDLNGRFLFVNSALAKRANKSPEELLGKDNSLIFPLDEAKKTWEKDLEIIKSGMIQTFEEQVTGSSGNVVNLTTKGPIKDTQGEIIGLFGIARDITERKQVELELQKLNLDKDRFISILGHDLRGPVNSILLLLELLHTEMLDMQMEEMKELIDLAYKSAKNTSNLLDDVLLWATAQSGKMKFDPQIVTFKTDCLNIIELLQTNANAKNIAIELECEDSLEVYVDKNMLDTVLRNLISNAIKFTRKGGQITILAEKNTQEVVISVADNGVGIAQADIDKIFDKTQLFTSIGTNAEKGTGFGLKLCQEFVEKHGGKIWVESEVGKGTSFYFSLPNAV